MCNTDPQKFQSSRHWQQQLHYAIRLSLSLVVSTVLLTDYYNE